MAVRDSGTGIPDAVLSKMFEPFFTTKTADKGTGLGLSTVATIVQNHKGFIDISTAVGKGTTFSVYLPAASPDVQSRQTNPEFEISMGSGEWILVVDDERAPLEMTKEFLEAYGYNVVAVKDGQEALLRLRSNQSKIQVVITDVLMSGLGGQSLIDTVCKLDPNVIVICATRSTDEDMVRSNTTNRISFLQKPCATNELLTILSKILKAQKPLS